MLHIPSAFAPQFSMIDRTRDTNAGSVRQLSSPDNDRLLHPCRSIGSSPPNSRTPSGQPPALPGPWPAGPPPRPVELRRFADGVTRLLVSYAVSAPDDPPEVVAAFVARFLIDGVADRLAATPLSPIASTAPAGAVDLIGGHP